MLETTTEGFMRMLSDPWLFIWHIHLGLTFIHFITWQVAPRRLPGPCLSCLSAFTSAIPCHSSSQRSCSTGICQL